MGPREDGEIEDYFGSITGFQEVNQVFLMFDSIFFLITVLPHIRYAQDGRQKYHPVAIFLLNSPGKISLMTLFESVRKSLLEKINRPLGSTAGHDYLAYALLQ